VELYANPQKLPALQFQIFSYKQYSGLINMAIDHYLASDCLKTFDPIFRFYGWNPFCLSIGYHQSKKKIDMQNLENDNYNFIRRPTGGRAIFHAEELTYSVIFPKYILSQKELYSYIHSILASALNRLGYNVVFASKNAKLPKLEDVATDFPCFTRSAESEVEYNGKKLIGSAQKIYPNSILQHGSILIDDSHKNLSKYLIADNDQLNLINNEIKSKTICLKSIICKEITPQKIETEILRQLESGNNISLIFKEFDNQLINEFQKSYENEFNN
jgi:lipoyl(octanoyl) transferase